MWILIRSYPFPQTFIGENGEFTHNWSEAKRFDSIESAFAEIPPAPNFQFKFRPHDAEFSRPIEGIEA
jgi:hypothetical protein